MTMPFGHQGTGVVEKLLADPEGCVIPSIKTGPDIVQCTGLEKEMPCEGQDSRPSMP